MTGGEKRSSDISSRFNKRGGKLISKTLGKSSSPPSISAPPKVAVGAPKAKKDEVQRRKSSLHDMLRGTPKEQVVERAASLTVSESNAASASRSHGSRSNVTSEPVNTVEAINESRPQNRGDPAFPGSDKSEDLEKALATAKAETQALRLELERVKQDAQASVEISRYQAAEALRQITPERDVLNQQGHRHEDSDDGMIDREEDLVNQNQELRSRLARLQDQLHAEAMARQPEASHSEEDWDNLTLRLHEAEKESQSRLQQLLSLKSSISTLTRTDSQISDSELADSISQLANKVREWVVSNYRRTKMSFNDLPEASVQVLQSIKADYQQIDGADKFALYQAVVSRTLMQIFDEPLCVGLPDHDIYAGLKVLYKDARHSSTEFREWRRTTVQMIERSVQAGTIDDWLNQRLSSLAVECEVVMRSISTMQLTSSARSALIGILMSAANLQRVLGRQKAEYSVVFFDTLDVLDRRLDHLAMEPVNDLEYAAEESNEPIPQRNFTFCVFPCLKKVEDGLENIVFKARVCCGVG